MKQPKQVREEWAISNGYKNWEQARSMISMIDRLDEVIDALMSLYAANAVEIVQSLIKDKIS